MESPTGIKMYSKQCNFPWNISSSYFCLFQFLLQSPLYNSKTISIKGYSWPKAHDLHRWRQNVYLWMGLLKCAGDLDKPQTALRKTSTICSLDSKNTNLRKYLYQVDIWYTHEFRRILSSQVFWNTQCPHLVKSDFSPSLIKLGPYKSCASSWEGFIGAGSK